MFRDQYHYYFEISTKPSMILQNFMTAALARGRSLWLMATG